MTLQGNKVPLVGLVGAVDEDLRNALYRHQKRTGLEEYERIHAGHAEQNRNRMGGGKGVLGGEIGINIGVGTLSQTLSVSQNFGLIRTLGLGTHDPVDKRSQRGF